MLIQFGTDAQGQTRWPVAIPSDTIHDNGGIISSLEKFMEFYEFDVLINKHSAPNFLANANKLLGKCFSNCKMPK